MLGGEVEAHSAARTFGRRADRLRLPDANDLDVVAGDREVLGHDRRAARRQRGDQLAFRPGDAVE